MSALNETDFNWVYSRLQGEARDELDPLIREIKEIGFDISQNEIDGLIEKNIGGVQSVKNNQDASFQLIANASYDEMQKIFSAESSILLNSLMSIANWEWKADKRFTVNIRTNGGVKITDLESKKLLRASILKATAEKLKENKRNISNNQPFKTANPVASFLGKLFKRNKKWEF
ncbi:MAG: hypothetical protein ACMZ63_06260 [Methylotenera sp.]